MGLDNPLHILLLLMIVLLVFGARRLPEIGRSLGDGMRGFKDSLNGAPPPAAAPQLHPSVPARADAGEPVAAAQERPAA